MTLMQATESRAATYEGRLLSSTVVPASLEPAVDYEAGAFDVLVICHRPLNLAAAALKVLLGLQLLLVLLLRVLTKLLVLLLLRVGLLRHGWVAVLLRVQLLLLLLQMLVVCCLDRVLRACIHRGLLVVIVICVCALQLTHSCGLDN